jgi:hypothetical protein
VGFELGGQAEGLSLVVGHPIGAPELIAAVRGGPNQGDEEGVAGLEAPRRPKGLDRELGVTANPADLARPRHVA